MALLRRQLMNAGAAMPTTALLGQTVLNTFRSARAQIISAGQVVNHRLHRPRRTSLDNVDLQCLLASDCADASIIHPIADGITL